MEVVLEKSEGVPEGAVLSIKVGDTKRQAPVSNLGQAFRFTPLAQGLPVEVEILLPAAPAKTSILGAEEVVLDFGGDMKVSLSQREVREVPRPQVDVVGAAGGFGYTPGKIKAAQQAAAYLEEYDLIKLFQEMLHGLLVSKPEDPFSLIEEQVGRARRLATPVPEPPSDFDVASAPLQDPRALEPVVESGSESSVGPDRKARVRLARREAPDDAQSKVDTLLMALQSAQDNIVLVKPFLPADLRAFVDSTDLKEDCKKRFEDFDTKKEGRLRPSDLVPVMQELTQTNISSITESQCRKFLYMFDMDHDELLSVEEFTYLIQSVIIGGFLESPEGHKIIEMAMVEENHFNEFLCMIEADKERLWSVLPFLPKWLVEHVTSVEFRNSCDEHFELLDVDKSGNLEPVELIHVIRTLSEAHSLTIDEEKSRRFTSLFDPHENGYIRKEDFVEFAQFVTVMSFLGGSSDGPLLRDQADHFEESRRLSGILAMLEEEPDRFDEVLRELPQTLVAELSVAAFKDDCDKAFDAVDKTHLGLLPSTDLVSAICALGQRFVFDVNEGECAKYVSSWARDGFNITKAEFLQMAKYALIMAFLRDSKAKQDNFEAELALGQEKVGQLMAALKEGVDQIADIIPFLPREFLDMLFTDEFAAQCNNDFKDLDRDSSGVLEPQELLPIILNMVKAQKLHLTEEHAQQFVDIFDAEGNGVISEGEFGNLVRFMMIMAFMQTEDGQKAEESMRLAKGQEGVQELLRLLGQDRTAIDKVRPVLPPDVFEKLTGDTASPNYQLRPEGAKAVNDALRILADSKKIEDLLDSLEKDRRDVKRVIPYLPEWLRQDVLSERFTTECLQYFQELDKDGNGTLETEELFPLVLSLSHAHPMSLDVEQCRRFSAIFDDAKNGVITKDEFVEFSRFLIIMGYLRSQEGQQVLDSTSEVLFSSQPTEGTVPAPSATPALAADTLEVTPMGYSNVTEDALVYGQLGSSPSSPAHLAVDCDFYQRKSERLSAENEELRSRLSSLEVLVRQLEKKMEEQGRSLRHAEVDLRANGATR
mmetsp:Transcript_29382/g.84461  ORF Transcript_29382/g.84461 Transcript_29382/m.84461 type:complete len:1046 (+) Transcript_29382:73-3210(+)